ncbi:type II secretion system ATPase GspE [Myxococcota bacterium]|nr:type II secretion system ATPase GspE [Myxococcota bacterium]
MAIKKRRLGDLLIQTEGLSPRDVDRAVEHARKVGCRIGQALVRLSLLDERAVARALATQYFLPVMAEIPADRVDLDLIRDLPITFAKNHGLLPLGWAEGRVDVVIADPLDLAPLDDLRLFIDAPLRIHVAGETAVLEAINKAYDRASRSTDQVIDELAGVDTGHEELIQEIEDIIDASDDAPIIRFVNSLFAEALKERASDIHIEPFERELSVRFRIDGVLYEKVKPPKKLQSSIISRVKIMSNLDIAEKRLPQDGRIRIKVAGRDVDIRTSTVPVAHGERVVMRLQDRSQGLLSLDQIGIASEKLTHFRTLIRRPHGIILVTGPTGSGKTTTLYAAISEINRPDINILTVEDPIEYQIQGIGQVAVNPKIHLTFASGLRSFLRQDPDVILVGEIRDQETAEIAIQASLTGHLVLSTLHTNDAATSTTRLVDMGVEPFLVSSSLIGIMAQRLVRRVCVHCRQPHVPTDIEMEQFGLTREQVDSWKGVYRAVGCDRCFHTGYQGRSGIYELLMVDDETRQLIVQNRSSNDIKRVAMRKGMRTLRDDGVDKVGMGLTTFEEVLRVTQDDAVDLD